MSAYHCNSAECPVETFRAVGGICPVCQAPGIDPDTWEEWRIESLAAADEELRRYGPPDDPDDRAPIGGDYWRDPESGEYRYG
jgi:hypothetical protein